MSHEEKRNIVFNEKEKKNETDENLLQTILSWQFGSSLIRFHSAQNSSFKLRDVDLKVLKECKGNMPAL